MYKLVISGGDSFTFGAELATDNSVEPNPNSWANLVAQRIGEQHINVARSGRSNSYIVRHVLTQVETALRQGTPGPQMFVQVMWTFADRHEFAIGMHTGEYDSPWMYLTPYSDVDETKSEWFKRIDPDLPTWHSVYSSLLSLYHKNIQLGIVDFVKHYKKLTQSTPLNDSYTSVKEILLLQNTLELHKIPYLFTYVNQHVMLGVFDDAAQNVYVNSVSNLVHKHKWYCFPGNHQQYVGFDDWARHNNYTYATSHPLEAAHADAAELIYSYINERYVTNGN